MNRKLVNNKIRYAIDTKTCEKRLLREGLKMFKKVKKFISILLVLIFIIGSSAIHSEPCNAMSQVQINKKIATLQKQIKTLKLKQKKAKALEKKQKKGLTPVYGEIISRNPYILYNSLGHTYYWINNPQNMKSLFTTATGYVKSTRQYRYYGDLNCIVVNAIKVSSKSYSYASSIKKKTKKLNQYKRAKKDYWQPWVVDVNVGESTDLIGNWKFSGHYNTLTWKSLDQSIATVDKDGRIWGKKAGTTEIWVTASASKKIGKCTVTVSVPIESMHFEKKEYVFSGKDLDENGCVELKIVTNPEESNEKLTVRSYLWSSSCEPSEPMAIVVTRAGIAIGNTDTTTPIPEGTMKSSENYEPYDRYYDDDDNLSSVVDEDYETTDRTVKVNLSTVEKKGIYIIQAKTVSGIKAICKLTYEK